MFGVRAARMPQEKAHGLIPHCAIVAPVESLTLLLGIRVPAVKRPASAEVARRLAEGEELLEGSWVMELSMRVIGARVLEREPEDGEREWMGVPRGEGLRVGGSAG